MTPEVLPFSSSKKFIRKNQLKSSLLYAVFRLVAFSVLRLFYFYIQGPQCQLFQDPKVLLLSLVQIYSLSRGSSFSYNIFNTSGSGKYRCNRQTNKRLSQISSANWTILNQFSSIAKMFASIENYRAKIKST